MTTLPPHAPKSKSPVQLTFIAFKTWKLYELRHPLTKETRYVGITRCPLEKRLKEHLSDPARNRRSWLDELEKGHLFPDIVEVADTKTFDKHEAERIEAQHIQRLLSQGCNLINWKRSCRH